jgi:hypothetical protein
MAKIKIKDLSKGVKVSEEELKRVRGGISKRDLFPLSSPFPFPYPPPRTATYDNYEICSYIQSMACGCPG